MPIYYCRHCKGTTESSQATGLGDPEWSALIFCKRCKRHTGHFCDPRVVGSPVIAEARPTEFRDLAGHVMFTIDGVFHFCQTQGCRAFGFKGPVGLKGNYGAAQVWGVA